MSLTPFTWYQGATKKTISNITSIVTAPNQAFVVDTTPTENNSNKLDSVVCNILFSNFVPDPVTAPAKDWKIKVVLEAEGEGNPAWRLPIGQMFESLGDPDQGLRHVITVQPNLFNIDEGVPIDLFDPVGGITRLSRQQGVLKADFCAVIEVSDGFAGTADALQSFDVEIFGEYYNHV